MNEKRRHQAYARLKYFTTKFYYYSVDLDCWYKNDSGSLDLFFRLINITFVDVLESKLMLMKNISQFRVIFFWLIDKQQNVWAAFWY